MNSSDPASDEPSEDSIESFIEAETDDPDLSSFLAEEEPEDDVEARGDDVTLQPGANADPEAEVRNYIDADVFRFYDVYSYRHAAAIFHASFPDELAEIQENLMAFRITVREIGLPGGNETVIARKFTERLRERGWNETRIQGDLLVKLTEYSEKIASGGKRKKYTLDEKEPLVLKNYIDGHKIDFVKGRVALDLEWNSKDQTFDRDLYALRLFHECGVTSVAALVTRSEKLNRVFATVPKLDRSGNPVLNDEGFPFSCKAKYGASTTWIGKLLYRMNAGRSGGCPVLIFAIRPEVVTDWNPPKRQGK